MGQLPEQLAHAAEDGDDAYLDFVLAVAFVARRIWIVWLCVLKLPVVAVIVTVSRWLCAAALARCGRPTVAVCFAPAFIVTVATA
jgi:hypothetical protein